MFLSHLGDVTPLDAYYVEVPGLVHFSPAVSLMPVQEENAWFAKKTQQTDIFDEFEYKWGCLIVSRSEVGRFLGGLLNPRTMASRGVHGEVPGKITIGNRVVYRTKLFAAWMRERSTGKGGAMKSEMKT